MKHLYFAGLGCLLTLVFVIAGCGAQATPTPPTANPNASSTTGTIRVLTFNDLNANGTADTGEPGIQDSIGLSKKDSSCPGGGGDTKATTQTDGTYTFKDVPPGSYCVLYQGTSAVASSLNVLVNVKAGEQAAVNFAVLANH